MADCKEIDAALARLSSKIDGLNSRLNNLEQKHKECCDKKLNNNSDISLEALIRRIAKLEESMTAVSSFLLNGLRPFIQMFNNITNFLSEE